MEITYKITNQEMEEILSKELGTPVGSVIRDMDGNFIVNSIQGNKVLVENNSGMDTIREDFTNKFSQDKTERILSFFEEFFNGLKETTHPDYPDSIFFYKEENGKKIAWMEQDSKIGTLWCRWSGFWSFFNNEIGLNYTETQYVVKTMVGQHLEREVGTPSWQTWLMRSWVGQHLEREVGTPDELPYEFVTGWDNILNER